jgi:tetratricopeptide (TPR) repeat protein
LAQQVVTNPNSQSRKRHYLVPNRHSRDFVGRQDILAKIDLGFSSGNSPRIVVLQGLGGQGKTQIALQYCQKSKNEYTAIFWVNATSKSTLEEAFSTISEKTKSNDQVLQDSERVQFVIDSLQEWQDPWLMVFDNYDDPDSFNNLQDFMPNGEHGCILITSRHAASKELVDESNAIELPGLPKVDALSLFCKQVGATGTASTTPEADTPEAERIVDRLGYHPLAITQASSYIKRQKIEIKDFMTHYDQQRRAILEQTPQMTTYRKLLNNTEGETSMNVFTTWELSFQQLLATGVLGHQRADILTLFAFFDSKDISEELFGPFCEEKSPILRNDPGESLFTFLGADGRWNSSSFINAINILRDMSLVQSWWRNTGDGFCHLSLHPLIRDWIRLRKDQMACYHYSLVAAQILAEVIKATGSRSIFGLSLPTKQAILSHIHEHEGNIDYLPQRLDSSDSELLSPLILAWYTAEETFVIFLILQRVYEEAETISRRAFEGKKRIFGSDHSDTVSAEIALGMALMNRRKFEEAEKILRNVFESRRKKYGSDAPETFAVLQKLGDALREQGKNYEAAQILGQLLERVEKLHGPEHLEMLYTEYSLGAVLVNQGRYDKAELLFRHALEGIEKSLGVEHPDTLSLIYWLAFTLRRQKRLEEALPLYQRACDSYRKSWGKEHPDTLELVEGYAQAQREVAAMNADATSLASSTKVGLAVDAT